MRGGEGVSAHVQYSASPRLRRVSDAPWRQATTWLGVESEGGRHWQLDWSRCQNAVDEPRLAIMWHCIFAQVRYMWYAWSHRFLRIRTTIPQYLLISYLLCFKTYFEVNLRIAIALSYFGTSLIMNQNKICLLENHNYLNNEPRTWILGCNQVSYLLTTNFTIEGNVSPTTDISARPPCDLWIQHKISKLMQSFPVVATTN